MGIVPWLSPSVQPLSLYQANYFLPMYLSRHHTIIATGLILSSRLGSYYEPCNHHTMLAEREALEWLLCAVLEGSSIVGV